MSECGQARQVLSCFSQTLPSFLLGEHGEIALNRHGNGPMQHSTAGSAPPATNNHKNRAGGSPWRWLLARTTPRLLAPTSDSWIPGSLPFPFSSHFLREPIIDDHLLVLVLQSAGQQGESIAHPGLRNRSARTEVLDTNLRRYTAGRCLFVGCLCRAARTRPLARSAHSRKGLRQI